MTDGPENLVLEQLRAIRTGISDLNTKVDRLDERLSFVETRMGHIEISEGHTNSVLGQVNLRLLSLEQASRTTNDRLAGIEQHLANGKGD